METQEKVIIALVIIAAIVLLYYYPPGKTTDLSTKKETMAPLGYGSYENKYPRGSCDKGSFERTPCMVGNCNMGSTVTEQQFCYIECAQLSDNESRQKCYAECMGTVKSCGN